MPYALSAFDANGLCMVQIFYESGTIEYLTCAQFDLEYAGSISISQTSTRLPHILPTTSAYTRPATAQYATPTTTPPPIDPTYYSTSQTDSMTADDDEPNSGYWARQSSDLAQEASDSSSSASVLVIIPDNVPSQQGGPPSSLPIILSVVFGSLFFLTLVGLLLFFIRRRRARRNEGHLTPFRPHGGDGILADRRISTASSHCSHASTSSFVPEPTFIQPVLGSIGLVGSGVEARTLTSREKRLTMRRAGGQSGAGGDLAGDAEPVLGMGGEEDYGDEVLRRKMDGWSALARERDPSRAREEEPKNPFADTHSVYRDPPSLSSLPSRPPPLRLPLTVTTSMTPPRASPNPYTSRGPSPVSTLSPQFDPSYSPSTEEDPDAQAEDGGVSLMGGALARPAGQAPPAYRW